MKIIAEDIDTEWGTISFATSSHDQYAAMQAADLQVDKSAMLGTGTAWVINGKSSKAIFDDKGFRIHPGCDLDPNVFGYITLLGPIGRGFEKLIERMNMSMDELAGIENSFDKENLPQSQIKVDLTEGTFEDLGDPTLMIRRFMEAAAARVAFFIEKLFSNDKLQKLVMTGGATASNFWPQTIANICQIPVEVVELPEFTAYGAAMFAKAAVDEKCDIDYPPEEFNIKVYEPEKQSGYNDWYLTYQRPLLVSGE